MNIERIKVFQYELPLAGALRTGNTSSASRTGLLVKMDSGDFAGWGEAAPLPGFSVENVSDVTSYFREVLPEMKGVELGPELPPRSFFDDGLSDAPPSARCAIETACANLIASARSLSLRKMLNEKSGDSITINALLTGSRDEVVESARHARDAGFKCVKLKVGRESPSQEIAAVRDVRKVLGDDIALRLDANRAWTLDEALSFGRALDVHIEYIEEPLRNPAQLPQFAEGAGLPIALDETLSDTPWSIWTQWPGVTALVVKPTLLGGLYRARRIAEFAASRGQRLVISSSFESGVGLLGLMEMAAAFGGPSVAAGLDTYRWLMTDLLEQRLPMGPVVDLASIAPERRRVDHAHLKELSNG